MTRRTKVLALLVTVGGAVALGLIARLLPAYRWMFEPLAFALLLLVVLVLIVRGLKVFLWRVGRRLAFSYFLIGIVPIPMVVLLFLFTAYLHAGYFLGHLYRDAVQGLELQLHQSAASQLGRFERGLRPPASDGEGTVFAFYRDGRRLGGSTVAPELWPAWLLARQDPVAEEEREAQAPFVVDAGGRATLVGAAVGDDMGILAIFDGDLEAELSRRADLVVRISDPEQPAESSPIRVSIGSHQFNFHGPLGGFRAQPVAAEGSVPAAPLPFWKRRLFWWTELAGPVPSLDTGITRYDYVAAALGGTAQTVYRHLFSSSAEVDTVVWGGLLAVTGLLSTLYAIALAMALSMIFTLSRAVNRLSRATDQVRDGEFSVRIPVRRHDQIGQLQRSFNQMAANLDELVVTATQKEVLERELQIASELQQSLLPSDLPAVEAVDFSSLFEPSAAIGGDYFDILDIGSGRLAVVIADVSGHGLPTGLRMAMLKAALTLLVEQGRTPVEILRKLDDMVRSQTGARYFVTLTMALIDPAEGTVELTNAGHPPTYLLRRGEVEEIVLPGPPLGGIGNAYGRRDIQLESGDALIWLSDGLIEALDWERRPFGYEGVVQALAGEARSAEQVRDRLIAAVARHTGTQPIDDDRTLLVMTYRPDDSTAAGTPSPSVE